MSLPYTAELHVAIPEEDTDVLHHLIKVLEGTSADLGPLQTLRSQLFILLPYTLLFGILTVLEFTALWLLAGSKALKRTAALFMIVTTLIMYIATAINWGVIIRDVLATIPAAIAQLTTVNTGLASIDVALTDPTMLGEISASVPMHAPYPGSTTQIQQCATTGSLIVNISLGDAIVLWRASILWRTHRAVLLLPLVLLLATFAVGAVNMLAPCRAAAQIGNMVTHAGFGGTFTQGTPTNGEFAAGTLTILLTLSTNLSVTTLIALKALEHKHSVAQYLRGGSRRTQAEKVMILLVDLSMMHGTILRLIILSAMELYAARTAEGLSSGEHLGISFAALAFIAFIVRGCLIPLIAIYPTLIVLLVALKKTPSDSHSLMLNDAPGVAIADSELSSRPTVVVTVPGPAASSSSQVMCP
ncbi:hypothetical protein C8Q80DRAFT_1274997 [Daedaleopsis nitida]|nr:hypothetical protein C8Q80DRAFT_1274997 [Daedaleopsis nitida]